MEEEDDSTDSDVRFWCLVVTRIRMQRWHVNSLGTVLSETITTVSFSAALAHVRMEA